MGIGYMGLPPLELLVLQLTLIPADQNSSTLVSQNSERTFLPFFNFQGFFRWGTILEQLVQTLPTILRYKNSI